LGTIVIALATFSDALKGLLDRIIRRPEAARTKLTQISLKYEARDFVENARRGDLHAVKTFLAARMNPDASDYEGTTALIAAASNEDLKIIRVLLKAKANVNRRDGNGCTALSWAIFKHNTNILRLFLRKGADPKSVDRAFVTAACRVDIESLKILLENGADVSKVGTEALICAAGARDPASNNNRVINTVEFLLSLGVDPKAKDEHWTALLQAAWEGHVVVVQRLLDLGADIDARCQEYSGPEGWTALMMSIDKGYTDLFRLLLERGADVNIRSANGDTALIVAAASDDPDVVRTTELLIDKGADVDAQDQRGNTALMEAASYYKADRTDVVHALLKRGASVDKRDVKGRTALHHAAELGYPGVITGLLNKGADINVRDALGKTPLMYATTRLNTRVLHLLLKCGASVHDLDVDGKSALQFAEDCQKSDTRAEVLRALRAAGAK